MPQPKKGARFGGSPAHHNMMMANLATELFRHGRITTTHAKAKTVQPLAEKMITFAKRGDLARPPPGAQGRPRQGRRAQAVRRHRPGVRRAQRRLHPRAQDRSAQGRQRADGAHRARRGRRAPTVRRAPSRSSPPPLEPASPQGRHRLGDRAAPRRGAAGRRRPRRGARRGPRGRRRRARGPLPSEELDSDHADVSTADRAEARQDDEEGAAGRPGRGRGAPRRRGDRRARAGRRGRVAPPRRSTRTRTRARSRPTAMPRVRIDLAYDGTGFRGFARQAGSAHRAGHPRGRPVHVVRRGPVETTVSGRTDAGRPRARAGRPRDVPAGAGCWGTSTGPAGRSTPCAGPRSPSGGRGSTTPSTRASPPRSAATATGSATATR
jgi:hypothetical protein